MKKPNLYIMCGLPRAGKSTWVKRNKKEKIVISPDTIRREIFGHQFHQNANSLVFAFAENMAILLLKQGVDVIIDATHITSGLRNKWKPIAEQCGAKVTVVWVYINKDIDRNLDVCLERNKLSPKDEKLPVEALQRMAMSFCPPDSENIFSDLKWFDIIEYRSIQRRKRNNNKT